MILLYINNDLSTSEYKRKRKFLTESIWYYFGDTLIISERNYPALICTIKYHKPIQFIVESIDEFDLTATEISEMLLVIFQPGVERLKKQMTGCK